MQIHDLAKLYETKTHEELVQLGADSAHLTPEAHIALAGELAKRRIDVSEHLKHQESDQGRVEQPKVRRMLSLQVHEVGEFVAEVLRVYHGHFWLFVKLVAPAVVVGYIAVFMGSQEGREIALSRGVAVVKHPTELLEVWFANLAGYFISWMAFSFSFGAICSAVRQIEARAVPSVPDSFAEVRKRDGSFLRLSLLLFFLCLIAFGASFLLSMGVLWLSIERHVHLSGFTIWVSSFGFTGLALLVLSRFALAVPAVILDDYGVGQAMFRSDELTEGKWLTLAALLAKSLIGGYVAGMFPFWLASWIPGSISLPSWFPWVLTVASIAGVTVVEPTMCIGFVLLYSSMSAVSFTSSEARARQLA